MVNYFWLIWKDVKKEKKIEKAGLRSIWILVVAKEYLCSQQEGEIVILWQLSISKH